MRRSYAGMSKPAGGGSAPPLALWIAMSLNVRIDHCRRAWESPLQTGYEHGQYDSRVQATMRCQLGRVR